MFRKFLSETIKLLATLSFCIDNFLEWPSHGRVDGLTHQAAWLQEVYSLCLHVSGGARPPSWSRTWPWLPMVLTR